MIFSSLWKSSWAGNLTKRTDARGVITEYRYDALNRLLAVHYPADTTLDVAYHYDNASTLGVGRLDRISDQTGQRRQAYDGRGNNKIGVRTTPIR